MPNAGYSEAKHSPQFLFSWITLKNNNVKPLPNTGYSEAKHLSNSWKQSFVDVARRTGSIHPGHLTRSCSSLHVVGRRSKCVRWSSRQQPLIRLWMLPDERAPSLKGTGACTFQQQSSGQNDSYQAQRSPSSS